MQNGDQAWDDIHFGKEEIANPNPGNVDDDELPPAVASNDDELEQLAGKGKDDDTNPAASPAESKEPKADITPVSENHTGIERYLAQFDIEGGMIQFEDGTSQHFNDLDAERQEEILSQLHASQAATVEAKYGLDETEIGLLNYLRSNNLTVEQMVDAMVQERVAKLGTLQEMESQDFTKMDKDALYVKFLKETSPEATAEQLASDLAKAKELSNFEKLTETLRTQFIQKQEQAVIERETAAKAEHTALIESQRQEIVNAVIPMTDIAGIPLDQNIKNSVLDSILETNEDGDSAFMDEVFSDPKALFNAAFWVKYGPAIVTQRDEQWKKEKSAAYKRGREDALNGKVEPQGKTFIAKPKENAKPQPHANRQAAQEAGDDWTELHNE